MNRRGQIALFVLIGLAILIAILLAVFWKRLFPVEIDSLQAQKVAPVQELVASCTSSALEQLLRRAGANGGYLDTSHLRHSGKAHESETILFPPQDVPYWSHLKPCSTSALGCEASAQPPLCKTGSSSCPIGSIGEHSVQEQLERALPVEIETCLNGFLAVKDQFDVVVKGKPSVDVTYGRSDVRATFHLALDVTDLASGSNVRLDEFHGVADVDLLTVYRMANDLANAQRETSFLERMTLHLLSVYSGLDTPLPPMRAVTVMGAKRYWVRTQVEQTLQEEVLPWTDFIQVPNAIAGFRPVHAPDNLSQEEQLMFAGIIYNLYAKLDNNETYPDLKVKFRYPGTKPYLSINGGQELLKPRSADVNNFLSRFSGVFMNDYRFKYDLAYPVIVTVTDTAAFNGRGYDWSFALEANIWHNEPVNRSGTVSNFLLLNDRVDFTAPHHRVRNTLRIQTVDQRTGQPLPGVRITYRCGEDYFIEETNDYGRLETRLPYCRYGGVILYGKNEYLGDGLEYDNYEEDITKYFTLALWPLEDVTLTMRKRTPANIAFLTQNVPTYESIRNQSSPLNTSDLAIVTFTRVKDSPYQDDVPVAGFYTFSVSQQNFTVDIEEQRRRVQQMVDQGVLTTHDAQDWLSALADRENQTITQVQPSVTAKLAPGAYEIEAFLIHNKKIEIPKEKKEFCLAGGGSTCIGKKEMELPASNLTTWLSGGAALRDDRAWQLSPNILYTNEDYTLYVLEQALPKTWGDIEDYQVPEEYAKGKELLEQPTFG